MKDISKEIIARIKEGNLTPEPRFKLQWKSYASWALVVVMIIVGAISASLVIFSLMDFDRRVFHYMRLYKFFWVVLVTAPYLWIFLSILALVMGVAAFRKTARGYRRSLVFVASLAVLVMAILGTVVHIMKINMAMDAAMARHNAFGLRGFSGPRESHWVLPGDGLIGGEVVRVGENEFYLMSFKDEEWKIAFDEKTDRNGIKEITIGDKIGIIGEKTGDFLMQAFSMRKFPADWNGLPDRKMMPRGGGAEIRPMMVPVPVPPDRIIIHIEGQGINP